ncbi:unnamed protein product [Amoebophrya sp. A25]|nr:unnamed protein product [Amoebophrya sp. A25]|eukprot:GSA25T00010006001.1
MSEALPPGDEDQQTTSRPIRLVTRAANFRMEYGLEDFFQTGTVSTGSLGDAPTSDQSGEIKVGGSSAAQQGGGAVSSSSPASRKAEEAKDAEDVVASRSAVVSEGSKHGASPAPSTTHHQQRTIAVGGAHQSNQRAPLVGVMTLPNKRIAVDDRAMKDASAVSVDGKKPQRAVWSEALFDRYIRGQEETASETEAGPEVGGMNRNRSSPAAGATKRTSFVGEASVDESTEATSGLAARGVPMSAASMVAHATNGLGAIPTGAATSMSSMSSPKRPFVPVQLRKLSPKSVRSVAWTPALQRLSPGSEPLEHLTTRVIAEGGAPSFGDPAYSSPDRLRKHQVVVVPSSPANGGDADQVNRGQLKQARLEIDTSLGHHPLHGLMTSPEVNATIPPASQHTRDHQTLPAPVPSRSPSRQGADYNQLEGARTTTIGGATSSTSPARAVYKVPLGFSPNAKQAKFFLKNVKSFKHVVASPLHLSAPLPPEDEVGAVKSYYKSLRAAEQLLKDKVWSKLHTAEQNRQTILHEGSSMASQALHEQLFHPIHNTPNACTTYTKASYQNWDTLPGLPLVCQGDVKTTLPHVWPCDELSTRGSDGGNLVKNAVIFDEEELDLFNQSIGMYADLWLPPRGGEEASKGDLMRRQITKEQKQNSSSNATPTNMRNASAGVKTKNQKTSNSGAPTPSGSKNLQVSVPEAGDDRNAALQTQVRQQPLTCRNMTPKVVQDARLVFLGEEETWLFRPAYARILATIQPFFRCTNFHFMVHLCDYFCTPWPKNYPNPMQYEYGLRSRDWPKVFGALLRFEIDSLANCGIFIDEAEAKKMLFAKCLPCVVQMARDVFHLFVDAKALHEEDLLTLPQHQEEQLAPHMRAFLDEKAAARGLDAAAPVSILQQDYANGNLYLDNHTTPTASHSNKVRTDFMYLENGGSGAPATPTSNDIGSEEGPPVFERQNPLFNAALLLEHQTMQMQSVDNYPEGGVFLRGGASSEGDEAAQQRAQRPKMAGHRRFSYDEVAYGAGSRSSSKGSIPSANLPNYNAASGDEQEASASDARSMHSQYQELLDMNTHEQMQLYNAVVVKCEALTATLLEPEWIQFAEMFYPLLEEIFESYADFPILPMLPGEEEGLEGQLAELKQKEEEQRRRNALMAAKLKEARDKTDSKGGDSGVSGSASVSAAKAGAAAVAEKEKAKADSTITSTARWEAGGGGSSGPPATGAVAASLNSTKSGSDGKQGELAVPPDTDQTFLQSGGDEGALGTRDLTRQVKKVKTSGEQLRRSGHMSLGAFAAFCVDFRLVPNLIDWRVLEWLYKTAETCEVVPAQQAYTPHRKSQWGNATPFASKGVAVALAMHHRRGPLVFCPALGRNKEDEKRSKKNKTGGSPSPIHSERGSPSGRGVAPNWGGSSSGGRSRASGSAGQDIRMEHIGLILSIKADMVRVVSAATGRTGYYHAAALRPISFEGDVSNVMTRAVPLGISENTTPNSTSSFAAGTSAHNFNYTKTCAGADYSGAAAGPRGEGPQPGATSMTADTTMRTNGKWGQESSSAPSVAEHASSASNSSLSPLGAFSTLVNGTTKRPSRLRLVDYERSLPAYLTLPNPANTISELEKAAWALLCAIDDWIAIKNMPARKIFWLYRDPLTISEFHDGLSFLRLQKFPTKQDFYRLCPALHPACEGEFPLAVFDLLMSLTRKTRERLTKKNPFFTHVTWNGDIARTLPTPVEGSAQGVFFALLDKLESTGKNATFFWKHYCHAQDSLSPREFFDVLHVYGLDRVLQSVGQIEAVLWRVIGNHRDAVGEPRLTFADLEKILEDANYARTFSQRKQDAEAKWKESHPLTAMPTFSGPDLRQYLQICERMNEPKISTQKAMVVFDSYAFMECVCKVGIWHLMMETEGMQKRMIQKPTWLYEYLAFQYKLRRQEMGSKTSELFADPQENSDDDNRITDEETEQIEEHRRQLKKDLMDRCEEEDEHEALNTGEVPIVDKNPVIVKLEDVFGINLAQTDGGGTTQQGRGPSSAMNKMMMSTGASSSQRGSPSKSFFGTRTSPSTLALSPNNNGSIMSMTPISSPGKSAVGSTKTHSGTFITRKAKGVKSGKLMDNNYSTTGGLDMNPEHQSAAWSQSPARTIMTEGGNKVPYSARSDAALKADISDRVSSAHQYLLETTTAKLIAANAPELVPADGDVTEVIAQKHFHPIRHAEYLPPFKRLLRKQVYFNNYPRSLDAKKGKDIKKNKARPSDFFRERQYGIIVPNRRAKFQGLREQYEYEQWVAQKELEKSLNDAKRGIYARSMSTAGNAGAPTTSSGKMFSLTEFKKTPLADLMERAVNLWEVQNEPKCKVCGTERQRGGWGFSYCYRCSYVPWVTWNRVERPFLRRLIGDFPSYEQEITQRLKDQLGYETEELMRKEEEARKAKMKAMKQGKGSTE